MSSPLPDAIFPRRWTILAAILTVLLMTPLDASAVNVILPVLQGDFHLALGQVAWVALIYLVVLASLILPMGRLGDLFGFRRLYLGGILLFTLASACCGLASSFGWLVAARVLQGIGACMMMAVSSGMTTALFPVEERGRALGMVGMAVAVGTMLGPTLGGWLTSVGGWRWIFFINIPIGLLGGYRCYRLLPQIRPNPGSRVDWMGALLAMVTLSALMLTLTQGTAWGWGSPRILVLIALTLGGGTLFTLVEQRSPAPMLDFCLFRHPVFTGANIGLTMNYLGQYCATFLVPKLLEDGLHLPIGKTGLVMIALPAGILALAPLSGALSDRMGTRVLATVGESLVAAGLALLAWVAPLRHLPAIVGALALIGIGAGLFQSPNNSAIMGSVPRTHLGIGGGVLATMRNVGMALGITISSVVVTIAGQRYLAIHPAAVSPALVHSLRLAFLVGAGFALLGAITSATRADHVKRGRRTRTNTD